MNKSIISILLAISIVFSLVIAGVPGANASESAVYSMNAAGQTLGGYDSIDQALADNNSTIKWYQLNADLNGQTISKDILLDLNGHHLTDTVIPEGITLTGIDSATNNYTGNYGTLSGTVNGTIAQSVKTAEDQLGAIRSYVTVCEEGIYSFHRYFASITAISLSPNRAALGYKAEFYGDDAVKNAVVNYGYELWINDYPSKSFSKTDKLADSSLTLRLQNILKEGNDALNAIGSTAAINGKAFITMELNGKEITLSGAEQSTTLRKTVEAIDANVSAYTEAQLDSVRALCTTYAPWMQGWSTANIFGIGGSEPSVPEGGLDVEIAVNVVAENNVLTEGATLSINGISAYVPQGTLVADNTTKLVLTIREKNASSSDVALKNHQSLIPLDVHIDGIDPANTTPIIVCLGEALPKGLNIGNYTLYHVENANTVEMVYVSSPKQLDAHNEFHYEPATGAVTVCVASFSEISLVASETNIWKGKIATSFSGGSGTENDPWLIANADQLAYMSQLVSNDAAYADDCYKLLADVDFGGQENAENKNVFYPIGYWKLQEGTNAAGEAYYGFGNSFQGEFDGNGNTVAGIYQNTWLMDGNYSNGYWDHAMGLFGACYNATVKNLTIDNFSSEGEYTPTGCVAAYAGGQNMVFENIYLTNCNPRVYNTGNGGIVGLNYNSTSGEEDRITFRNITVDQTNTITALWGSWDVACGGIMGRLRENSLHTNGQKNHVTFENCHVAAIIDAYNDVCANYQYYLYRYCGMMIGTVDYINEVEGIDLEHVVDAEKCTVTYGDWNEYWYCELVANSIASYTHDHQFSRLQKISSIDEISNDNGKTWKEAGNFVIPSSDNTSAKCYHIVEKDGMLVEHTHDMSGTEVVNGETIMKEDRTCYFIPFGQLFAGYGYGPRPVYDVKDSSMDITITEDDSTTKSQQKFQAEVGSYYYVPGTQIKIGDLFAATVDATKISQSTLQVFVSPANTSDTISGIYNADTQNWENGTLTISGTGIAKITITDYFYCVPTTITVDVRQRRVYYVYENEQAYVDVSEESVTLPNRDGISGWTKDAIPQGTDTPPEMFIPGNLYPVYEDTTLYAVYYSADKGYYTAEEYCPHLKTTSSVTLAPTCTDTGTATITCLDCHNAIGTAEIEKLGHSCEDAICQVCQEQVCGDNITWSLQNGVLTLTGTGATWLYKDIKTSPFIKYVDQVTSVVIGEGITRIEEYLFYDMKNITSVTFPESIDAITNRAFACCTGLKEVTFPESLRIIGAYAFRASGVNNVYFKASKAPEIISPQEPFKYCNYTITAPCTPNWEGYEPAWGGNFNGIILQHTYNDGSGICTNCNKQYCGDFISWTFDNGVLTLTGTGSTYNFELNEIKEQHYPFLNIKDQVREIVVSEGITILGKHIFYQMPVEKITLPETLTLIDTRALGGGGKLTEIVIPGHLNTLGHLSLVGSGATDIYIFGGAPKNISETPLGGLTYNLHIPCSDTSWTEEALNLLGGNRTLVYEHNFVDGACECGAAESSD